MENKKPFNVFNGLKTKLNQEPDKPKDTEEEKKNSFIAIEAYQNSRNISKPFVKPISKII